MTKHLISLFLSLMLLLTSAAAESTAPDLQGDILVLFTSDVHCGVDQNFGYAGLQAVRDAAVKAGNHVLLVDDGDSIQGEPIGIMSRGQANIELMNAVKYDVAIPGNHEFDYGMDRFYELVEMAEFPYISCNFTKNGELVFAPYVLFQIDGVKVAFVGATTPETLASSTPKNFQDEEGNYIYSFSQGGDGSDFYNKVQTAVDAARAEGADYVFLMGHLGNEGGVAPYMYSDVISHTSGIDALLDGHSHDTDKVVMKNKDGKDVIRQACGTKMSCIGWLRIDAKTGNLDTGLYTWNNPVSAPVLLGIDNELNQKVTEATTTLYEQLSTVIGKTTDELMINDPQAKTEAGLPIRIVRRAETNLGDLCADAIRASLDADIGMINGGNIRMGIGKGDVTINNILGVFPFQNKIVLIEATGQQILDSLEFGVRAVPEESGSFLHVSGLTFTFDPSVPSTCVLDNNSMFVGVTGERRIKTVMVGNEPLDPNKTYTVAGTEYTMLENGDGHTAFNGSKVLKTAEKLDYEIIVDYIQNQLGGVIGEEYANPYGQERIVAVTE